MKNVLLPLVFLPIYLASVSFVPRPVFGSKSETNVLQLAGHLQHSPNRTVLRFDGITINPAPDPPAPYMHSVYFRYGALFGDYFKVESVDGCPFYAVNYGAAITYTPVTYAEHIFGIFFKTETGCGSTRYLRVSYNNGGTWTPFQNFVVNL